MNKRDDARKLKPAAQHMLRRQVVNAVRDGMKQVEAANLFRASLRAVNKWVALDKLGGLRALELHPNLTRGLHRILTHPG